MKVWSSILLIGIFLVGVRPLVADPLERARSESGLRALDAFVALASLDPGEKVIGMVGFYGEPEPVQWLILSDNPTSPGVLRESVFARRKVLAERKFNPLPGQDLPHLPIVRADLKIDSGAAFRIAEKLANHQKRSFESVHYQLRVRDLGTEPVWMLNLINSAQISIGIVYLSASTGTVLRESWPGPEPPASPPGDYRETKVSSR